MTAFTPTKVPSQAGNEALDARTPAIAPPPTARALQGLPFFGELARGGNGHALDARFLQSGLRLRRMDAPIPAHQTRWMRKERLVVLHRFHRLPMLIGVLQNLVARHDAALHFIQDDLPPKFDQRAAFMARDGAGMRLK